MHLKVKLGKIEIKSNYRYFDRWQFEIYFIIFANFVSQFLKLKINQIF